MIDSAPDTGDVLPAESVAVDVTCHTPPVRAGRSHELVPAEAVNVHWKVLVPFVAYTVTRSPFVTPGIVTVGVVSLVTLSVLLEPVSDDDARSGIEGTLGAERSRVIETAVEAAEVADWLSVIAAVTDQMPSLVRGRAQVRVEAVTVKVHVTLVEPDLAAVRVTDVPSTSPTRSIVGDDTFVTRSVLDVPVSDAVASDGVGATSCVQVYVPAFDTLPAASVASMVRVCDPAASAV